MTPLYCHLDFAHWPEKFAMNSSSGGHRRRVESYCQRQGFMRDEGYQLVR